MVRKIYTASRLCKEKKRYLCGQSCKHFTSINYDARDAKVLYKIGHWSKEVVHFQDLNTQGKGRLNATV